jgi:AcrR family transcriptional regulator
MENEVRTRPKARPAASPGRGRPPRISREAILEAAASLLEQGGGAQISLNAIARVLSITPMAIYTYFASKDDLLQALSEKLLSDLDLAIPAQAPPLEKILLWSHAMRAHFLKRPPLIEILVWEGGHASVSWVRQGLAVEEALSEYGLRDEALAQATLWVWRVVMGAIHVELRERQAPQRLAAQEIESVEPDLRIRIARINDLGRRPTHEADFFAYQLDRMLDALKGLKQG